MTSGSKSETADSLEEVVGAQIRNIRNSTGLTIAELAQSASISTGMLSRIENGHSVGSLSTLSRIAEALNVPISSFFSEYDRKSEATFTKSGQGIRIERRGTRSGHVYQLLGHQLKGKLMVEPYLITLDENSNAYPIFQHEGIEFIYMLEGVLGYRHGLKVYSLEPGDSLFFDCDTFHGPMELIQLPAKFLSIIISSKD